MKRYFCDKCGKQIDIDKDGYEEFMACAACANDMFGRLEGMERA